MAGGTYSSSYKGSQFDLALGLIINSGLTATELAYLRNTLAGTAVALKALVLDANKDISGIRELILTTLTGRVLKLQDTGLDVTTNPPSGYAYLFVKNSELYIKTSLGVVTKIAAGKEPSITTFTDVTSVVCTHNLLTLYPSVMIVGSDEQQLIGQVLFQTINQLTVSFNNNQSGKVICRY